MYRSFPALIAPASLKRPSIRAMSFCEHWFSGVNCADLIETTECSDYHQRQVPPFSGVNCAGLIETG